MTSMRIPAMLECRSLISCFLCLIRWLADGNDADDRTDRALAILGLLSALTDAPRMGGVTSILSYEN